MESKTEDSNQTRAVAPQSPPRRLGSLPIMEYVIGDWAKAEFDEMEKKGKAPPIQIHTPQEHDL